MKTQPQGPVNRSDAQTIQHVYEHVDQRFSVAED
jgi:hypothetical protein